jgi:hypothetical protein
MAKIQNDNQLKAALIAAPSLRGLTKFATGTEGIGTTQTLFRVAGFPGIGNLPPLFSAGAGYIPTKADPGAWPFTNAAVDGNLALLLLAANSTVAGTVYACDRLWACRGFSTVNITAQTIVTPGTLPTGRNPNNGLDVEPWLEVYTAPGATAATWTLTGTDALGNANRTWTYAHPANAETLGQGMLMTPGGASPAAVLGCGAPPVSLTCSVSSGTAGDIGLTLRRRLSHAEIMTANIGDKADIFRTGGPPVFNDSCVEFIMDCTTTSTGLIKGLCVIGESPI